MSRSQERDEAINRAIQRSELRTRVEESFTQSGLPTSTRLMLTNAITDTFMTQTRGGLEEILRRGERENVPPLEQLADEHHVSLPEDQQARLSEEALGVLRRHVVYTVIDYRIGVESPYFKEAKKGATNFMGHAVNTKKTGVNPDSQEPYL